MDKIKKYHLDKILKHSSPQKEDLILKSFKEFINLNKKEEAFYLFNNLFLHAGTLQYENLSEKLQNEIKDIMANCLIEKKFDYLDKFWIVAENGAPSVKSNLRHKLAMHGDAQCYDYIEKKNLSFEDHYVVTSLMYKNYTLAHYLIDEKKMYKGSENLIFIGAMKNNCFTLMHTLYSSLNKKDPDFKKDIFSLLGKFSVEQKNKYAEWLLKRNFDFTYLFEKNSSTKSEDTKLLNDMSRANLFKLYQQAEKKDLLGPYVHLHMQQHNPNEVIIEIFFEVCGSSEKVMKNLSRSNGYEKFFNMLSSLVLKERLESNFGKNINQNNSETKGMKI